MVWAEFKNISPGKIEEMKVELILRQRDQRTKTIEKV